MAEDARRSAEIRRMASHKVAAELLKVEDVVAGNAVNTIGAVNWDRFVELVDKLDEDVVAAGDRAERGARVAPNWASSEPEDAVVVSEPSDRPSKGRALARRGNGSDRALGASESPSVLDPDRAAKLAAFLALKTQEIDDALIGLKLMSLGLSKTDSYENLSKIVTVDQAKELVSWVKEQVAS